MIHVNAPLIILSNYFYKYEIERFYHRRKDFDNEGYCSIYMIFVLRQFAMVVVVIAGVASILASFHTSTSEGESTTAQCDPQRNVRTGSRVDLDARGSNVVGDKYLYYKWLLRRFPQGSQAELSDPDILNPSFIADVDGDYVVELQLRTSLVGETDDRLNCAISSYTDNAIPVAIAGAQMEVMVGQTVQLDASLSFDADDDVLGYSWTFDSPPNYPLSDRFIVNPTFVPSAIHNYILELVVNDGTKESARDAVIIYSSSPGFSHPVAMAGPDQYVVTDSTVQLDGRASYSPEPSFNDFTLLGYEWRIISRPHQSAAVLSNKCRNAYVHC